MFKICLASWIVFALSHLAIASPAKTANSVLQESARSLNDNQSDANTKFLTSGEVDTWAFEAKKNEVLIVRVTTTEFDSVVGLAKVGTLQSTNREANGDDVLFSNDNEGSSSQFRHRITKAGKYKIRVHAYKMKGGGNYRLSVQRYEAKRLEMGKPRKTESDRNRNTSFFFDAELGQFVTLVGSYNSLYGPNGNIVQPIWSHGVYLIREKGEYLAVGSTSHVGQSHTLEVRPAVVGKLSEGDEKQFDAKRGTLHNWEIAGQKGQFALIKVARAKGPRSRVIFDPPIDPNELQLDSQRNKGPAAKFLPVASKGKFTTYAIVFGRNGKFLLQTHASQDGAIKISMKDPTVDLTTNPELVNRLEVGGSDYFGFDASAGDLVKFNLGSETFDSVLRLFDGRGQLKLENDDFQDSTNSEITFQVPKSGYYRWQVGSLGNGGGGEYRVDFVEVPKRKIAVGEKEKGVLEAGRAAYWSLKGSPGKSVYLSVRSKFLSCSVEAFTSSGRQISGSVSGVAGESLIPMNLGSDGTVTIRVSSRRAGDYEIRVIDADWDAADKG